MSKEKAREIQRKLRWMNCEGYVFDDEGGRFLIPCEHVYVVNASDDILFLYYQQALHDEHCHCYPRGRYCCLLNFRAEKIIQDKCDDEQWLAFSGIGVAGVRMDMIDKGEKIPITELTVIHEKIVFRAATKDDGLFYECLQDIKKYRSNHRKECEECAANHVRWQIPHFDFIMS